VDEPAPQPRPRKTTTLRKRATKRSKGATKRERKPRGAPSKRTPARRAAILKAIREGAAFESAARSAGIGPTTFKDWRRDDPEFEEAVQNARAEMEVRLLECIGAAATEPKTWQAAAWKLERLLPDRYAPRRQPVEVTGPNGGPINVEGSIAAKLDELDIETLRKLAGT